MKNKLSILVAGFILLFYTACSNEDVLTTQTDSEFKIVSSILPMTRTPQAEDDDIESFKEGDENSLFFYTSETKDVKMFNYTYGTSYKWSDFQLPEQIVKWNISACYPPIQTSTPESFEWDVTSQSDNTFLLATPKSIVKSNEETKVELAFKHGLHKMTIELAGNEDISPEMLANAEISCHNFHPTATFNLLTGETTGVKGDLINQKRTGKKADFIIPAQAVGSMEIHVKLGKSETSFKLSECKVNGQSLSELKNGQSFTLDIQVTKDPEKPNVPSEPEKPSVPSEPEKPNVPSEPEKPNVPSEPEKPNVPSEPEKPNVPSEPEKPNVPSEPEKPNVPSEPEKPNVPSEPEKPNVPSEPEKPNVPSKPEKPNVPSEPEKPNVPSEPEKPNVPSEPEKPNVPSEPEKPNVPDGSFIFTIIGQNISGWLEQGTIEGTIIK